MPTIPAGGSEGKHTRKPWVIPQSVNSAPTPGPSWATGPLSAGLPLLEGGGRGRGSNAKAVSLERD